MIGPTQASHAYDAEVPIIEAIKHHTELDTVPFHIPGHKQGIDLLPQLQTTVKEVSRLDLTELPGQAS